MCIETFRGKYSEANVYIKVSYDVSIYVCIETFGGKYSVANVCIKVSYDVNIYVSMSLYEEGEVWS